MTGPFWLYPRSSARNATATCAEDFVATALFCLPPLNVQRYT